MMDGQHHRDVHSCQSHQRQERGQVHHSNHYIGMIPFGIFPNVPNSLRIFLYFSEFQFRHRQHRHLLIYRICCFLKQIGDDIHFMPMIDKTIGEVHPHTFCTPCTQRVANNKDFHEKLFLAVYAG